MVTNGSIPLNQMVMRDGVYLWPSTAVKFDRFAAELVSLGYEDPRISTPLGGYRSLADQEEAKRLYGSGAATPGFSKHGLGRAFDVNNIGRYPDSVIARVGLKHGLVRNAYINGALEVWHFYDVDGIMPAGGGSTPISTSTQGDNDMRLFQVAPTVYFATSAGVTSVDNPDHLNVLRRLINSNPAAPDNFNGVERDWIISYINRAQNDNGRHTGILNEVRSIGAAGREHTQAALNNTGNALSKQIADKPIAAPAVVDAAALAVALAPLLKSVPIDYAAIAAAVNADASKRLAQ